MGSAQAFQLRGNVNSGQAECKEVSEYHGSDRTFILSNRKPGSYRRPRAKQDTIGDHNRQEIHVCTQASLAALRQAPILISLRCLAGVRVHDQLLVIPGDQLLGIIVGTVFVFSGLAGLCIAAMRRRSGMRAILWLGVWSAMYGSGR